MKIGLHLSEVRVQDWRDSRRIALREAPYSLAYREDDRGAVEESSRGPHGGECGEPSRDPRCLQPERADRGAVALFPEWQATRRRARHSLRRTLGLTMRPLRGRTEVRGGTAGRVCSLHSPPRPTAISFDRSAVDWRRFAPHSKALRARVEVTVNIRQ